MKDGKKYNLQNAIVEIIAILIGLLFLIPFYIIIINSFKSFADILTDPTTLPKNLLFDNYKNASQILNYPRAFLNSFIITVASNVFLLIIGSMAAYKIARKPTKIHKLLFSLFVAAMVIPFQSIMIPLMRVVSVFKLINSYHGIVICYLGFGVPITMFLYHGFIKSIPLEIEEAAIIDGCSTYKVFWKIVFPLLKPMTVTIAVLNSLWIWNDFLLPSLILTESSFRTIPLATSSFFSQYTKQWDLALAGLVLGVTPIIIFFFLVQKQIIKGITAGSVKG